jgi:hypothetical protein
MKEYIIRKLQALLSRIDVTSDEFESIYKLAIKHLELNRNDSVFLNRTYSLIAQLRSNMERPKEVVLKEEVLSNQVSEEVSEEVSNQVSEEVSEEVSNQVLENENQIIYLDKADKNGFDWGGVRSGSKLFEHPMKASPMFFRRDGMVVDVVNIYQNSAVFLICNGPSFKEVNHDSLRMPGILTMGINNGAHVFRPNLWSCVDDPSRFMKSIWEDPKIMKIVPQAHFEKKIYDKLEGFSEKVVGDCPNVIGFRRNEHFREDRWLHEHTINWGNHKNHGGGRSVMISSLKICYLLGFKRIYLVGCDFNMTEENGYFFEEKRSKSAVKNNMNSYEKMEGYFSKIRPKLEQEGVTIYNLNPKSKLKAFDYMNFSVAIEKEKIDVNGSTIGMYESPRDKEKK